MDHGIVNLGGPGSAALGLAGFAPGIPGMVASGLNALGTANNLRSVDALRGQLGIPGLSMGQVAGSFVGLPGASGNNYGTLGGNNTIANPDQWRNPMNGQSTAITTGGIYDSGNLIDRALAQLGGMFGLGSGFANALGAKTPFEAMQRNAMVGTAGAAAAIAPRPMPGMAPAQAGGSLVGGMTPVTRADGTIVGYKDTNGNPTTPSAAAIVTNGGTPSFGNGLGALGGGPGGIAGYGGTSYGGQYASDRSGGAW